MKARTGIAMLAVMMVAGTAQAAPSVEDRLAVLQEEIEHLKLQVTRAEKNSGGIKGLADRTTLGGYGELHYNRYGGGATSGDMIDLHRFVLFFGHRFNDRVSFKSELEFEHTVTKDSGTSAGAVELEQAYLDFNLHPKLNAKVGVFLIPLGILNETHEPPAFYGVERNEIETRIIPSTWWEAGVGVYGEALPGFQYQLNLTSSPDIGKLSNFSSGFRNGRRQVSEAPAEDYGFSGALNYNGVPGLLVGAAFFSGNTGQNGVSDADLSAVDARLTVWDVHARYQKDRLDLRALYARGRLDDAARVNSALGKTSSSTTAIGESFYGWYVEAAYRVWQDGDQDFASFVRYEKWDTHDEVPSGYARNSTYNNSIWTVGANYRPHPQVVLKADYQDFDQPDSTKGDKRLNMGMGYMF